MNTFNRYKKSANQRRNERIRNRCKTIPPELRMHKWVVLPVNPQDNKRGDLSAPPKFTINLRKQEVDQTNYFCIANNHDIRYEKYSEWVNFKWKEKNGE